MARNAGTEKGQKQRLQHLLGSSNKGLSGSGINEKQQQLSKEGDTEDR